MRFAFVVNYYCLILIQLTNTLIYYKIWVGCKTTLPDLRHVLPQVYDNLIDGRTWTAEAEATFGDAMLTDGEKTDD